MAARDVTVTQGLAYPVPARTRRRGVEAGRLVRRGGTGSLIALMVVGSIAMWTAIPFGGLWLAAQLNGGSTRLSPAAALVALVGIPVAMVLAARGLAQLERVYMRLTGTTRPRRVPATRRSVSDASSGPPPSVLDTISVVSVLIAIVAFAGWFFFVAGSSLPA